MRWRERRAECSHFCIIDDMTGNDCNATPIWKRVPIGRQVRRSQCSNGRTLLLKNAVYILLPTNIAFFVADIVFLSTETDPTLNSFKSDPNSVSMRLFVFKRAMALNRTLVWNAWKWSAMIGNGCKSSQLSTLQRLLFYFSMLLLIFRLRAIKKFWFAIT